MNKKLNLYLLFILLILLVPTSVFAGKSHDNCNKYSGYKWYGYKIVKNGVDRSVAVSSGESVTDYFDSGKESELNDKGVTGIVLFFEGDKGRQYSSKATVKKSKIACDGELKLIKGATSDTDSMTDKEKESLIDKFTCNDLTSSEVYQRVLQPAFKYIRIAVPCLLVVLCSFDFISAVVTDNQEKMKKAQGKAFKRILIGIIIFLLPTLMNALLNMLDTFTTCGFGL